MAAMRIAKRFFIHAPTHTKNPNVRSCMLRTTIIIDKNVIIIYVSLLLFLLCIGSRKAMVPNDNIIIYFNKTFLKPFTSDDHVHKRNTHIYVFIFTVYSKINSVLLWYR